MPVTEVSSSDRAAVFAEVERLTESSVLHGSEALCRLLRYLAEQFLDHPGVPVKEYQLAIDVFGRPDGFDPRMDSTVRVQTGRLRSKVSEYYASAGIDDSIILEIPKGSYSLTFHHRPISKPGVVSAPAYPPAYAQAPAAFIAPPVALPATQAVASAASPRKLVALVWILAAISVVSLALLAAEVFNHSRVKSDSLSIEKAETQNLQRFWAPFLLLQDPPWLVFSNAEFVGKPQEGMRYFEPGRDSRAQIFDHYTGVGEVLGVSELSRIFTELHHAIRVKRGRLLSLDDVKNNDLIFLGSPAENLTLREITTTREFVFRTITGGERKGDSEIFNVHPRAGEPRIFQSSSKLPIADDYGLIGLVPGINPSRSILVLAGTTTMGTQAAAEFVSREDSVKLLLDRVAPGGAGVKPFEAVIRVRISGGVPVSSTIVALHVLP